jgi:hypothetical protein
MTIYNLSLFLHIAGGFGLVAAFTVEAIGLRGLRRSTQVAEALSWLAIGRMVQRLAPASLGVILITGLYLMANYGGPRGWVVVALGSFVLIALVGAIATGLRMARIGPAVGRAAPGGGPLPDALRVMVRDPVMLISLGTRIGILLGILYLMTVKPSPLASLLVVGLAAVVGAVAAFVNSGTAGAAPAALPRSASRDAP